MALGPDIRLSSFLDQIENLGFEQDGNIGPKNDLWFRAPGGGHIGPIRIPDPLDGFIPAREAERIFTHLLPSLIGRSSSSPSPTPPESR